MTRYPLTWPAGWKRTANGNRKSANFKKRNSSSGWKERVSVAEGIRRVLDQLSMMGLTGDDILISTNLVVRLDGFPRSDQREPADPGVAVYWKKSKDAQHKVMAVDQYDKIADNLAAIGATLEAMRAIERHGGAMILERAFTGFTALPAPNTWRAVLGITEDLSVDLATVKSYYKKLSLRNHPDCGGTEAQMKELNWAMAEAEMELGI